MCVYQSGWDKDWKVTTTVAFWWGSYGLLPSLYFLLLFPSLWTHPVSGFSMDDVWLPRPVVMEHKGSSFISVSQCWGDGAAEGEGDTVWSWRARREGGKRGIQLCFLKVYLSKGSPTASLTLVDSVNVLTLLASPGTLGLIHTSKEVQQQCRGGREEGSRTCEATYGQP